MKYGDILVSRSGTIGRVALVTSRLVGAVVSDDMIRVRIVDETVRFYVYAYLQSYAAYDQMLKNEYGAIQQHLEAKHIAGILIPLPDKWNEAQSIIDATRTSVEARERFEDSHSSLMKETKTLLVKLIDANTTKTRRK